jgi:signal transduction histidine kinase
MLIRAAVTLGISLAALALFSHLIVHHVVLTPRGLSRSTGLLYPVFAAYFIAGWLTGLAVLAVKWRRASGLARVQLNYLGVGLVIATVGGLSMNLLVPLMTGNSSYSYLGPFFVLPLVLLVGHALIRHRLLDLRFAIGRSLGLALVVGGGSVAVLATLQELGLGRFDEQVRLPIGIVVVLIIIAILASAPLAPRLGRVIDAYLLRGRSDPDAALSDAARRLTRLLTPESIAEELHRILTSSLFPEQLVILTQPLDTAPTQHFGSSQRPSLLSDRVVRAAWELDEIAPAVTVINARRHDDPNIKDLELALHEAGVEVRITLGRPSQVLAIVLLSARKDGRPYFAPALQFLEELAELVSRVMETAYLHSRQVALERDRERLAHLARMGRSYAGLAHEIRTPLTTISTLVSMLPDRIDDPEYRNLMIHLLPSEVERITSLIDGLRALAPATRTQSTRVDISTLLRGIVSLFAPSAHAAGLSLALETAAQLPPILGDSDSLSQLFQNLIRNAIEASAPGSHIFVRAMTTAGKIMVQVIDEGTGVDPAIQPVVFEPFATTRGPGRGLGLSICLEIAEAYRARLTLRNREDGRGSIAEVTFHSTGPTAADPRAATEALARTS